MSASSTEWAKRMRVRLPYAFGDACESCGATTDLEFAHTSPTVMKGMGRGMTHRMKDIHDHPYSYKLLCQPCHKKHDGPAYRNKYA